MAEAARRDVPVDRGELRESIGVRAVDAVRKLWWRAFAGRTGGALLGESGGEEKGWYAHFVEFGTVNAPAQPFWFPNFRALRPRFRGRVTRARRQGVRDAIR